MHHFLVLLCLFNKSERCMKVYLPSSPCMLIHSHSPETYNFFYLFQYTNQQVVEVFLKFFNILSGFPFEILQHNLKYKVLKIFILFKTNLPVSKTSIFLVILFQLYIHKSKSRSPQFQETTFSISLEIISISALEYFPSFIDFSSDFLIP